MRQYQDTVARAVDRYGGHIVKFLGDGVLVNFGWPIAYEDQAERAVRAGLESVEAVGFVTMDGGETIRARAGIATGEVVIGDLIGDAVVDVGAVSGATPNLAARLQGVAEPGELVVGANTRRLIGDTFKLQALGPQTLKGYSVGVEAWRVIGEGEVESRFDAAQAGALTQFVGRTHELGLLMDRWSRAVDGEGQVVLLSGEAGIGKSRLLQTLSERIGDEPHLRLRYQCSSLHSNSALYPVIRQLEHAAGITASDAAETNLDKLEALLAQGTDNVVAVAPLIAALLSIPGDDRYGALELAAQARLDRTLTGLVDQLAGLSNKQPVLFLLLAPTLRIIEGLARISQTHLGGVSSGADEPGCGSICVALRQSGPGLIV